DQAEQADEAGGRKTDPRRALVVAQAKQLTGVTEHAAFRGTALALPFGLLFLRHEAHRLGGWVVGVRAFELLSFGVAVGSRRPSASSLRPISSSREGRFGRSARRASCWIFRGWR